MYSFAGRIFFIVCLYAVLAWEPFLQPAEGSGMKGPLPVPSVVVVDDHTETSVPATVFLAAITFYQTRISHLRYGQCGFRPSCSRYSSMAIREEGPLTGLMMTGDRLIRCNLFKKPSPDYPLLPGLGKLYDPPSRNLLHRP